MKFVRYGSLVPQKHKKRDDSFHSPPANSGFYAFPRGYIEPFLLGGVGSGSVHNGRYRYVRDNDGNKIKCRMEELVTVIEEGHSIKGGKWVDNKRIFTEKYQYLRKKYDPSAILKYWPESGTERPEILGDMSDEEWDRRWEEIENSETFFVVENKPTYFDYTGEIWFHGTEEVPMYERLKTYGTWVLVDIKTYKTYLKKKVDKRKFELKRQYGKDYIKRSPSGMPLCFSKDDYEVFIEKLQ